MYRLNTPILTYNSATTLSGGGRVHVDGAGGGMPALTVTDTDNQGHTTTVTVVLTHHAVIALMAQLGQCLPEM